MKKKYDELSPEEKERALKNLRKGDLTQVDLRGANLRGADLQGVNLIGADLQGVNLIGATLYKANLQEANLIRAYLIGADLRGADLYKASLIGADLYSADLRDANLRGADLRRADLRGADLRGADLRWTNLERVDLTDTKIDYHIENGLLEKVAEHALEENALDMSIWHTCETTHCIAGWGCYLAKNGKMLERGYGTQIAGLLLLGAEAHSHFFDDNQTAKEYLKKVLQNK